MDVDTANLNFSSWEVSKSHRLPKKAKFRDALAAMPKIEIMGEAYQQVFQIYKRRLERAAQNLRPSSKEGKALSSLAHAQNLDGVITDSSFLILLARFRTLDMVQGPA